MRESVAALRGSWRGNQTCQRGIALPVTWAVMTSLPADRDHYQKLSNKYEKNYDISEPTLSIEIDIVRKSPITAAGCKIIREVLYEENLHIQHIKLVTECPGPLPRMDHYKQMQRCHEMMLKIGWETPPREKPASRPLKCVAYFRTNGWDPMQIVMIVRFLRWHLIHSNGSSQRSHISFKSKKVWIFAVRKLNSVKRAPRLNCSSFDSRLIVRQEFFQAITMTRPAW